MKWTLALLGAMALAGTASAGVVDFAGYSGSCELVSEVVNPAGCNVGGVVFFYENADPNLAGTATLDNTGIDLKPGLDPVNGYIGGSLVMRLLSAVHGGVSFSFMVASPDPNDTFVLKLANPLGDTWNGAWTDPWSGVGSVSIPCPTGDWDSAQLTPVLLNGMAQGGNDFFITDINFDTPVPEPASFALIGTGLLLVGFSRRKLAGRKS